MSNKLSDISIADLLAFTKQFQNSPKAKPAAERKTPRGKSYYLDEAERTEIVRLYKTGLGVSRLAARMKRSRESIANVIKASGVKRHASGSPTAAMKPTPVVTQSVEDGMAEVAGLGSIKRSMERLHDRLSKVDARAEGHNIRLGDINTAVAKLQQSVDRITREFVTTNPPPAEIVLPTARVNGHRQ